MSGDKSIPNKQALLVLLSVMDKRMFLFYLALDIIFALLSLSVADIIGSIVDALYKGVVTTGLLVRLIIISLLTAGVKSLRLKALSLLSSDTTKKLQKKTMNVLLFGDFNTRPNLRTGNIISKVNSSISAVRPLIVSNIPWVISFCFSTIITLIYIALFLPNTALLSLLLIVVSMVVHVKASKRVQISDHENQKLRISLVENARDIIRAFPVIKSFMLASKMKERLKSINEVLLKGEKNVIPIWTVMYASGFILSMLPMITLLVTGALGVRNEVIKIGQLLTFCIMLRPITQSLMDFSFVIGDIRIAMTRIAEMVDIWDIPNEIGGKVTCPQSSNPNMIIVENLSFSYGSSPVLNNVSCNIARNKLVAFVGRSGSGKSTLIRILSSVLHVKEGCSFEGVEYKDLDLNTLRDNISYVPQESVLFTGTIYDNIACGLTEVTSNDVLEAIDMAGLRDFVESLPEREYTIIDGIDSTLSGGQRQRIALARALAKKCNLLILDEPTASVDAKTESEIMSTLIRILHSGTRTILISTHTLKLAESADMIYVFSEGKIVEYGTHRELIEKNSHYRELWESQQ